MKTITRSILVALPLLLASCASSHHMVRADAVPENNSGATITRDQLYVEYVERIARHRGIEVVWLNPPDKRAKPVAASQ